MFDIPLTWNQNRFAASRSKCRKARKLVEISINGQYIKELKSIHNRNLDIEKMISEINENLVKHEKKHCIINNLTDMASESISNHFDKRMEKVRTVIQEHCNGIQKALREESAYWNEIRSAIEQNLIISNDFHPVLTNSQTIINNQENSIRSMKSQAQLSMNTSAKSSRQDCIGTNSNHINSSKIIPSINKTYVVELDETTTTGTNEISPIQISSDESTTRIHESPVPSQPNPPAPLCFSPTIIQDERSNSIKNILSPVDQNITVKPKVMLNRVSQEVLSEYFKIQHNHQIENINVSIRTKSNDSIQRKSNIDQDYVFAVPEPVSRNRSRNTKKDQSESIYSTKTKNPNRKRKQSVSEDDDKVSNTRNLRKRKPMSFVEVEEPKPKRRAAKKKNPKKVKENEIPLREPSPLSTIDRLTRYSTRFSTRSQRSNNFTLLTSDTESGSENDKTKTRSERRKKFSKRTCHQSKNSSISVKTKKKST